MSTSKARLDGVRSWARENDAVVASRQTDRGGEPVALKISFKGRTRALQIFDESGHEVERISVVQSDFYAALMKGDYVQEQPAN